MVAHPDRISRRSFGALSVGALAAAATFRVAGAQDATPAGEETAGIIESLGLPTLQITAQELVFAISNPGALAEGWYAINLINESESVASANVARLPEGTRAGDLAALVSSAFKGEGGELPEWWASTTFAGGTVAAAGASSWAVVYLAPGQYTVFSTNPASVQSPANFRILTPEELESNYGIVPEEAASATPGASPVATPMASPVTVSAPEGLTAAVTLAVSDTGFTPSGAPATGEQVIEVVNEGEQVHDVIMLHTTEEVDEATAGSIATSYIRGEEINAMPVGGVGTLSPGATAYAGLTAEPGTYLVFSSLPDANGGVQLETVGVLVFTA
jgi:hypothetical protein